MAIVWKTYSFSQNKIENEIILKWNYMNILLTKKI